MTPGYIGPGGSDSGASSFGPGDLCSAIRDGMRIMTEGKGRNGRAGGKAAGGSELPAPPDLLNAPGYVARRLNAAYVAAWQRHVDPVLTGAQFAVLTAVDAYPGVEQGFLARAVALDRSTMGSLVGRLEARGLITRSTPAEDGRKRLLHLTDDGATTLRDAYARARALDRLLMKGCTEAEQEALLRQLNALSEYWESLVED